MKMTFAIPDELGRRFRAAVPAGERSAVGTDILRKKLRPPHASARSRVGPVNRLKALGREMADWKRFDDQSS